MLLNPKTKLASNTSKENSTSIAKAFPPTSYPGLSTDPFNANVSSKTSNNRHRGTFVAPGGNLRNVISFGDLSSGKHNGSISGLKSATHSSNNWGHGISLTSSPTETSTSSDADRNVDRQRLRDIWSKRFGNTDSNGEAVNSVGFGNKRNIDTPQGEWCRLLMKSD